MFVHTAMIERLRCCVAPTFDHGRARISYLPIHLGVALLKQVSTEASVPVAKGRDEWGVVRSDFTAKVLNRVAIRVVAAHEFIVQGAASIDEQADYVDVPHSNSPNQR